MCSFDNVSGSLVGVYLVARKLVFGLGSQAMLKPVCSARMLNFVCSKKSNSRVCHKKVLSAVLV